MALRQYLIIRRCGTTQCIDNDSVDCRPYSHVFQQFSMNMDAPGLDEKRSCSRLWHCSIDSIYEVLGFDTALVFSVTQKGNGISTTPAHCGLFFLDILFAI